MLQVGCRCKDSKRKQKKEKCKDRKNREAFSLCLCVWCLFLQLLSPNVGSICSSVLSPPLLWRNGEEDKRGTAPAFPLLSGNFCQLWSKSSKYYSLVSCRLKGIKLGWFCPQRHSPIRGRNPFLMLSGLHANSCSQKRDTKSRPQKCYILGKNRTPTTLWSGFI